ncbi:MAG: glycosyltransferase family 4 protein [Rhodothermaceae bacterium]
MNILQIAPQIPYPVVDGGKIAIYGVTKSLMELGHKVDFIGYRKEFEESKYSVEMGKICTLTIVKANVNNTVSGAVKNLVSKVPYNIGKFKTVEFEEQLIKLLKSKTFDVVHIEHLHMAWTYDVVKKYQNIPVILRQHNLEMKIMQRYAKEESNFFLRSYCKLQAAKFTEYEVTTCAKFDNCMMITEVDEETLLKYNNNIKTSVVPAGVDEKLFNLSRVSAEPFSLIHLGSMEWLPNKCGLEWYLSEVFPLILEKIPETKLYLIGKGTEKIELCEKISDNVIPLGFVDDLWKEVMSKDLAIVPLRSGSGMRIKIIEMMAAGQNILSTNVGAEGIGITDKKNILLADSAKDFADETINYSQNKYEKSALAQNAKEFCSERFKWNVIAKKIESVYLEAIKNIGN